MNAKLASDIFFFVGTALMLCGVTLEFAALMIRLICVK